MMSEVNLTSYILGDLVDLSQGLAINAKTKYMLSQKGLPLLRITDLINETQVQFVNPEHAPKKCIAHEDEIIYTRTGQVGLVFKGKSGVIHNNCFKVIPNQDLIDSDYLFWFLSQSKVKQYANDVASGSVQKDLNHSAFKTIPIDLPPLEYQKTVGPILNSFTDKIELNRQTNQTLENIAQAIFKSWFVDFEPTRAKIAAKQNGQDPERAAMAAISGKSLEEIDQLIAEHDVHGSTNVAGAGATQQSLKSTAALFPDTLVNSELGEIPEGWDVIALGEILEFNPKRTLKKGTLAPYLDMKNVPTHGHLANDVYLREMASGTKFVNGDTLLARITPCLENGKTAYVDFIDGDQVAWGSTEYIVIRPQGGRPLSLGYIIARLDSFRAKAIQTMTGTSGRQRANAKALSEQVWLDYPIELLQKFDGIAGGYLNKAKVNGDQSKSLAELRDALLPKLLSGELTTTSIQTKQKEAVCP